MLNKLTNLLMHELELMKTMVDLAELQQDALIHFKLKELEQITSRQDQITRQLRDYEDQRIKLLMTWLEIPRIDAINLVLSSIESKLKGDELLKIKKIRINMKKLAARLNSLNNSNRMLSNRAKHSVKNMMNLLTNSPLRLCNVKV